MAWTTPTSLACIAESNIKIVMEELKTALFQRQDALGISRSTGWSTSDHVATRMESYFGIFTSGAISTLGANTFDAVANGNAKTKKFVKSDLTDFGLIGTMHQSIIEYAGLTHNATSNWVEGDILPNTHVLVHRRETWIHLQQIFDSLVFFRRAGAAGTFGNNAVRAGGANSNAETAWDNAKVAADGIDNGGSAKWLHYFNGLAPSTPPVLYSWTLITGSLATYNLSSFSAPTHGKIVQMTAGINKLQSSRVMIDVVYQILFGAETWTLPANTTTSGTETYTFSNVAANSALGSTISRGILISTSEPADHYVNHTGLDTQYDAYIETRMGWPTHLEYIFFDITPALTYG